jgi:hypothetical protein
MTAAFRVPAHSPVISIEPVTPEMRADPSLGDVPPAAREAVVITWHRRREICCTDAGSPDIAAAARAWARDLDAAYAGRRAS